MVTVTVVGAGAGTIVFGGANAIVDTIVDTIVGAGAGTIVGMVANAIVGAGSAVVVFMVMVAFAPLHQERLVMNRIPISPKHGLNPAIPKCYYCLEDKNEIILPGRINLRSGERDVEAPHGAVWDLNPCDKCEKLMEQGVILISIRDGEKPPVLPPLPVGREPTAREKEERLRIFMWNPYRTGGWVVLTDDAVRRAFGPPEAVENILKKRYVFIAHSVFQQLGLPLPGDKPQEEAKPPENKGE